MKVSNQNLTLGNKAAGVGLIEVLVALLLIAIGAVGLARFQGVFFKEGGAAKARSQAAELAREKLDDLKSFTTLNAGAAGTFSYLEIGTNAGGAENPGGTLRLPSGTITLGNTTYTRAWTVTDQYYCGTNTAPGSTNCAPAKTMPDFRAVRVAMAWTDPDGTSKSLNVDGTIAAIDPTSVANSLINGSSSDQPIVPYTPGVAPNVIAIDIGGGQKKETTNPTPTLNKKGQAIINTIARYETIRFSSATNTISREEYTTLNCSCTQSGPGMGRNLRGQFVSKNIGVPADRDQASECSVCCRDHHDDSACNPTTSIGKNGCYDPYRPIGDYTSNAHNHYNANGQLANATGSTYVEACRLKRVNGDLLVAQDWNLSHLMLIPESFFAVNGTPNTTNITNYGTYVKNYVSALINGSAVPSKPWPVNSSVARNGTKPFAARGLYLDYLDDAATTRYIARIAANDATVFQEIPFYEVNLTKLAQWATVNSSIATVRNDQLITEQTGQNLYTRGLVTGVNFGVTNLRVSTTASNTGVINEFISTDPNDGATVTEDFNEVTVPGSNPTISGSITSNIPSGLTLTASNGGSCSTPTAITYACSVPYNWDGDVTPSASGYVFSPPLRSYTNVIAAQTLQDFAAIVSNQSYLISGNVIPALSSVTFAVTTGANCAYTSSSGAYSCTAPSNWTGSVTPSASGYSFAPLSRSYSNLAANQSGQDFTASVVVTTYTVSGSISPAVTGVSFTTTGTGISCTNSSSAYSCTVPSSFTGSITPTAAGAVFSPSTRVLSNVTSNITQNFISSSATYTISGTVTPNAAGANFAASNGGSCSYTSGSPNGSYSCTVPNGWTGTVTPTLSGSTFSPGSRSYTNVTSNNTTENYTVAAVVTTSYTISGTISNIFKTHTASIGTTAGSCSIQTNAQAICSGNICSYTYICTVLSNATTVLTPGTDGNGNKVFNPSSRQHSNVTSNMSGQNFDCTSNGGC